MRDSNLIRQVFFVLEVPYKSMCVDYKISSGIDIGSSRRKNISSKSTPFFSIESVIYQIGNSRMDVFQAMRVFTRVVDVGTFTAAAQTLGLSTAQVSRQVSELESHLQARLLQRTTRRLGLTEAQVIRLREEHGIYMVGDSRINIAGLNSRTVPILAAAIAAVGG